MIRGSGSNRPRNPCDFRRSSHRCGVNEDVSDGNKLSFSSSDGVGFSGRTLHDDSHVCPPRLDAGGKHGCRHFCLWCGRESNLHAMFPPSMDFIGSKVYDSSPIGHQSPSWSRMIVEQMDCRFVASVVDYGKTKRQTRCRQADETERKVS